MKTTKIEHLYKEQISNLTFELFQSIEITYGIKEADKRFIEYFINVLQKNYSHLNFEQLEDAFFRNSTGLLDNFLPKVGMRSDNKVMKFNIPDLTKVINAFCKYMGVEKNDTSLEKKVFSSEEIDRIHVEWIEQLIEIFNVYLKDKKRTSIRLPLYTANFLSKLGLINKDEINLSENKINMSFGKKNKKRRSSPNEILIYKCFDLIIQKEKHLFDLIPRPNVDAMPY